MTHVFDMDLPSTDKFVLLALADACNDQGITWIAITSESDEKRDLVKKTNLTARGIFNCVKRLEEAGHLRRDVKKGKGIVYYLSPEGYAFSAPSRPEWASDVGPERRSDAPESGSDKPSTNRQTSKKEIRARFVPKDWSPKPAHDLKAQTDGFDAEQYADLIEGFRHHEFDKPKTDFDLAFHTWIRNAAKFKKERNDRRPASPAPGRTTQRDENLASVQRGFMAALDGRKVEGGNSPEDDYPI